MEALLFMGQRFLQTLHYTIDWYSSSRFSKLWVKSFNCIVPVPVSSLAGTDWFCHWPVNFGNWNLNAQSNCDTGFLW